MGKKKATTTVLKATKLESSVTTRSRRVNQDENESQNKVTKVMDIAPNEHTSSSSLSFVESYHSCHPQTVKRLKTGNDSCCTPTSSKTNELDLGTSPSLAASVPEMESTTSTSVPTHIEKPQKATKKSGSSIQIFDAAEFHSWNQFLTNLEGIEWVCPVSFFVHAPFSNTWENIARPGLKIEVPHPQSVGEYPVNCIATVVAFAGYKALLKFESMKKGINTYAWMDYCSNIPKRLGYSVANQILLLPVQRHELGKEDVNISTLTEEFFERIFISGILSSSTIALNHSHFIRTELTKLQEGAFKLNQIVEIVDWDDPSRNRLALIFKITGDRLQLRYIDLNVKEAVADNQRYYSSVSMNSDTVHRLGWSHTVGFQLKDFPKSEAVFPLISKRDFPEIPSDLKIHTDMLFELRHPIRTSEIVTGYVFQVLRYGYFLAGIKTNPKKDKHQKFLLHVTSEYILPCGFCRKNNVQFEVPYGEDMETFEWEDYLKKTNASTLDLTCVDVRPAHNFVRGCRLEAASEMLLETYFGPATVVDTAEHLLLLHFDSWSRSNPYQYQWVSAFCHDIYPVGWAEMVGHPLQSHPEPLQSLDSLYLVRKNHTN